jgi:DNA-binding CsgD family transcriptional regulator
MNAQESDAVAALVDAFTALDDAAAVHTGVVRAVCALAGAEGGVLLLGRKFGAPAPGDVPDADHRPFDRARADKVLELLPVFGHMNPVLPLLGRIDTAVFSVPELVGRRAWENSPYYCEFLGPAANAHAVLGVSFGPAGGVWLGHPDRRRFTPSVCRTLGSVAGGIGRGLVNLARHQARVAALRGEAPLDADAARAAGLSPREVEIVLLLAEGLSHKQVAATLGVSYHTVTTHVRAVFAKLKVRGRVGALNALRARTPGAA